MKLEFDRPETPAEAGLREWAEAQAGGPSFARIHGALHGVIATSMEEADFDRSALRLLRIEAPEEIHALAVQATRELHALVPEAEEEDADELLTVPLMTEQDTFAEWLGGLGAVALSDPQPFMTVLGARIDLAQADQRKKRRGRQEGEEGEVLREIAQDIIFLMSMTPDEHLPADFPPPARDRFAELRQDYLSSTEWEPIDREIAILDALTSVHSAWNAQRLLSRMQAQQLLDGDQDWLEEDTPQPIRREGRKVRPNEPCPCGSGKKYKKCHGAPGATPLP